MEGSTSEQIKRRKLQTHERRHIKADIRIKDDPDTDPDAGSRWGFRFWVCCKVAASLIIAPCLLLVFLDSVLTSHIEPIAFTLDKPPQWEGNLAPNQVLSSAKRLFENKLRGPESIVVKDGKIFTGTADGQVLQISEDESIKVIAHFGRPPCGTLEDEPTCGRPLGMRFDKDGKLLVLDSYLGLFRVNVNTGTFEQLFPSSLEIAGKQSKFLNDLDIASNGDVYISDSSTKWGRRHNRLLAFEAGPYGRIIKHTPSTNTTIQLIGGLQFPNGVQLSHDENYLLFVETVRCRIMKYNLVGPAAGKTEEFASNLPGLPDNIRRSNSGGYWVGIAAIRRPHGFSGFDVLASYPYIRRFIAKAVDQETILKFMGNPYGMIIELDSTGKVINTLHDPSGKTIQSVSEVEDVDGTLYLGSYSASFIGKVDKTSY